MKSRKFIKIFFSILTLALVDIYLPKKKYLRQPYPVPFTDFFSLSGRHPGAEGWGETSNRTPHVTGNTDLAL